MAIKKPAPKTRGGRKLPPPKTHTRVKVVQRTTDLIVDLYGPAIKELANR